MTLSRSVFHISVVALLGAFAIKGNILFSNYGSGASGSYAVYGSNTIGGVATASAFTPGADATLDSFMVAADYFGGSSNFIMELASDSGGVPGSVLEQISFTLPSGNGVSNPTTVLSTLHTALSAGTQYWAVMIADPGNPDGKAEWFMNPANAGGGAQFVGGGPWTFGAGPLLEVDGTVPEPSTVALLGLGIAGVASLRKYRFIRAGR